MRDLLKFQSTHPRGVRPTVSYNGEEIIFISIHAPTWGATVVGGQVAFKERDFNPRTHVGCDLQPQPRSPARDISIHAPTWGATYPLNSGVVGKEFQSTHPRGVRPPAPASCPPSTDFNPRTHVGCDITATVRHNMARDFNPRTHVGCD